MQPEPNSKKNARIRGPAPPMVVSAGRGHPDGSFNFLAPAVSIDVAE